MSDTANTPPAPKPAKPKAIAPVVVPVEPTDVVTGKPIPFKVQPPEETGAAEGSRPTGTNDCLRNGGHGGPKGDRWYYSNYPQNKVDADGTIVHSPVGELVGDVRICEICGSVDI